MIFLDAIPRSRLLSISGGMAVAYVFLRILPDLSRVQTQVGREVGDALHVRQHPIYVVALLGLIFFYGLEQWADRSRSEQRAETGENTPSARVFWISMASYGTLNFLIGYLLVQRGRGSPQRFVLFSVAMTLWFLVNDHSLREQYRKRYHDIGRWVLIALLFLGWSTSRYAVVPEFAVSVALAFIGGGIVLNVLKEELPHERESRFWAFALGAAGYALLLLAL